MDLLVALVMVFTVAGSYSYGYLFLRSGWPKIRKLEEGYKIGWSIILGAIFSIIAITTTSIVYSLKLSEFSSLEFLTIVLAVMLAVILAFLSVRRKFFAKTKMQVSVPKEAVSADITAGKLVEKMASDRSFIVTKQLNEEKIKKIKEALKKSLKETEEKSENDKEKAGQTVIEDKEKTQEVNQTIIEEKSESEEEIIEEDKKQSETMKNAEESKKNKAE